MPTVSKNFPLARSSRGTPAKSRWPDPDAALPPGPAHLDPLAVEGFTQGRRDHRRPGLGLAAFDRNHRVAAVKTRTLRDRARFHLADHRPEARGADHEHEPPGKGGKQEVEGGAGEDDGAPGPQGLAVERLPTLRFRNVPVLLIQHPDVAAERKNPDGVLRAASPLAGPDGPPETDGEAQHPELPSAAPPRSGRTRAPSRGCRPQSRTRRPRRQNPSRAPPSGSAPAPCALSRQARRRSRARPHLRQGSCRGCPPPAEHCG